MWPRSASFLPPASIDTRRGHLGPASARSAADEVPGAVARFRRERPANQEVRATKPFGYVRPSSLGEATALLVEHGEDALPLLGGTDLVVQLRHGLVGGEMVIDLKSVPELASGVHIEDDTMHIGAAAVMSDLIEDDRVSRHFPALIDSARVVGSVQIRNRATLVGNICNASPAADTVPVMLVADATVIVAGPDGVHRVPLDDFIVGPGQTVLEAGQIVTGVDLPIPGEGVAMAFERATRRKGHDLAIVNLCCRVDTGGTTRFAFGAVGPRAFVVEDRTGVLADPDAGASQREEALGALISRASPISDVRGSKEYREAMLLTLGLRALDRAHQSLAAA